MDIIIDTHAHLGNILYPNGGNLIEKRGVRKKGFLDLVSISEFFLHEKFGAESSVEKNNTFIERLIIKSLFRRNLTATRENFRKSMDKAGVTFSVALPVPPYVSFADLKAAADKDPKVIPFTGIDYTRDYDIETSLEADVAAGAKGMKLHPILQCAPLTDKRTFDGVEAFAPHQLPIIMHTGVCQYYIDRKDMHRQKPSYGAIHYVRDLINAFPKVNFIIGHAGLYEWNDVKEIFRAYKNVWVETTFRGPSAIRELINTFGSERVLYGSDWPWGNRLSAIKALKKACQGNKEIEIRIFSGNAGKLMKL